MNKYAYTELVQNNGLSSYMEEYLKTMLAVGCSVHTHRRHQSALRAFIVWCDGQAMRDLPDISKTTLTTYRQFLFEYRRPNGYPLTKGSLNSKLTPLKKFIQWCAKEQYIPDNFAHDLEIPRKPRGIPTRILMHESIERILRQPDTSTTEGVRDRAILEVLYSTAMRRTEVTTLKCQDIDPIRRTIKVSGVKNGLDRFVPISERALDWISRYLNTVRPVYARHPGNDTLFLSKHGLPFQPGTLGARVKNYILHAGIQTRGSCHLFRHSTATQMLENGADIRYIQALLGHIDLSTTEIYTRVSIHKLREVHLRTHPSTANQ